MADPQAGERAVPLRKTSAAIAALTAGVLLTATPAAAEREWHHALSLVEEPRYPPDFSHFDWVNPDAPKGGRARLNAIGTFDSLNQFPVRGNSVTLLSLIYDQLMAGSLDEPSTEYGLVAEAVSYPDDYSSATFRLRPEARFHDGEPITPEDVIFSLKAITEVSPNWGAYYENVERVEKTGENEVTFHFDSAGNRELPHIVGQLTILPKHYWTGENEAGEPRDLANTTLEPPLGSGPYRIAEVNAGRSITYERVEDYWAKDLPVTKGQWNFDELQVEYFRDATVAFEAFKAGQLDYYQETNSKNWATSYNFDAVKQGRVKKEEIPLDRPAPMQAFVFNLRHDKFADRRVRRAFNLAFNFEWTNENLFYGQYKRLDSYFPNTGLAAQGAPEGRQKEILESLREEFPEHVPEEALTQAYENSKNPDRSAFRRHLRKATRLLKEAGWEVRDGVLRNAETGEPMQVEFLIASPAFERVILPYTRNLARLGVEADVRLVDSSQYRSRLDEFDYDIIVASFPQSESPGNEQRDFWGSQAAEQSGSRNLIGIQNPAIDKLIDGIIYAESREELVAYTGALDRVLLWQHYVVPQWYSPSARIAYWDKFERPETLPSQTPGFTQVWWFDPQATEKVEAAGQ
jgi:microcin C transport system substrate-binding protein